MKTQEQLAERAARQRAAGERARARYAPKSESADEPQPESTDDIWVQE